MNRLDKIGNAFFEYTPMILVLLVLSIFIGDIILEKIEQVIEQPSERHPTICESVQFEYLTEEGKELCGK